MCDLFCNSLRLKEDSCPIDKSFGYRMLNTEIYICSHGHKWKMVNSEKVIVHDIRMMAPSPFRHVEFPSTLKMINRNYSSDNIL